MNYTFNRQAWQQDKTKAVKVLGLWGVIPALPGRDSKTLAAFCVSSYCSAVDKAMLHVVEANKKSDCLPAAGYGIRPVCEGLGIVSVSRLRQHAND